MTEQKAEKINSPLEIFQKEVSQWKKEQAEEKNRYKEK